MVGTWIAFGMAAVSHPDTLTDFWHRSQRLSLAAEIGLWIGTLPWMLAIAAVETSWAEWLQITLISGLAVLWVLFPSHGRPAIGLEQSTGNSGQACHTRRRVTRKGLPHAH